MKNPLRPLAIIILIIGSLSCLFTEYAAKYSDDKRVAVAMSRISRSILN